jgi:hypothetical protein
LCQLQLAKWEADHHVEADPHNLADSEATEDNLPKTKAAHELFTNNGIKGSKLDGNSSMSIEEIVAACLKDIKKLKTPCTIKMVTQLTAVAEYMKLHCRYVSNSKCKRPCLNASLVQDTWLKTYTLHAESIGMKHTLSSTNGCLQPKLELFAVNTHSWRTIPSAKVCMCT